MSTQQSLAELQSILEKHRANQIGYRDKIKEINLTRGKISDQLQILQQTYDKKLKGLQQKLEILKNHNETLIRENVLYKSEIDSYQIRLGEKEKIIAMLLSQRKDLPVIGNSQRSKSQKTDSLNANEEQSKSFKKPTVFKEDIERPHSSSKFKQEIIEEKSKPSNILNEVQILNQRPVPTAPVQAKKLPPHLPKKKTDNPVAPAPKKIQPQVLQQVTHQRQPIKEEQKIVISNKPPMPSGRVKGRKNQPKNYPSPKFNSKEQYQQDEHFEANNFFSNLGKESNRQDKVNIAEQQIIPQIVNPQIQHQQQALQVNEQDNNLAEQANGANLQVEHQYHQEQIQPSTQQKEEQQHINTQQHDQTQPIQSPILHQQNNFLSHFNNTYSENTYEPPYQPPSRKGNNKIKKIPRRERVQSLDSEVSGNDFFSQLGRSQNEQSHNLEIEQSSIDPIDRDNSLMSNQQPYFAQQPVQVVKKPIKMPKKKGKRDQIKMMDPSCFE